MMDKILDNLNKYIKDDLVNWVKSNIKYEIYSIDGIETDMGRDLSKFKGVDIYVDLFLNHRLVSFYIGYKSEYNSYYLRIQNFSIGINLVFDYSIEHEKELFRIINLFSECFLNGHYIHDESYFYEGDNGE